MNAEQINAFEDCLSRIEAGEDAEQALARYPRLAGRLRPMLRAAIEARGLRSAGAVPAAARARSRSAFLTAALQAAPARRQAGFFQRRAFVLALAALLAVVLLATGITTAQATPGSPLYPVKLAGERAQMNLTRDPVRKLELEEEFESERIHETQRLLHNKRSEQVELSGLLTFSAGEWRVDRLLLAMDAQQATAAQAMVGYTVYLRGESRADGLVHVESLRLRLFELEGVLQQAGGDQWLVSQVKVFVTGNTRYNGGIPAVGSEVEIDALRRADGALEAVVVKVEGGGSSGGSDKAIQMPGSGEDDSSESGEADSGKDDAIQTTPQVEQDDHAGSPEPAETAMPEDRDDDDHSGSEENQKTLTPEEDHSGSDSDHDEHKVETPKPEEEHSDSDD